MIGRLSSQWPPAWLYTLRVLLTRCFFGKHQWFSSKMAITEEREGWRQLHVGGRCLYCHRIILLQSHGWVSTSAPGVRRAEIRRIKRAAG